MVLAQVTPPPLPKGIKLTPSSLWRSDECLCSVERGSDCSVLLSWDE